MTLHNAPSDATTGEERFQRAPSSVVGMAIVGLDGRVAQANPALAAMLGSPPDGLAGREMRGLIHADDRASVDRMFDDLIHGRGSNLAVDARCIARGGGALPVRIDATLLRDADHQPLYVVAQMVDVAQQRSGESALRDSNPDLQELEQRVAARTRDFEQARDDLQRFAYGVSHDLRAPLRSIASFSTLLADHAGEHLDEQALDYLRRIREAAQKMEGLLAGLQDLSRAIHGEFRSEAVDVSLLADWAGAELQDAEQQRAARIEVQPGLVARGDERALRQVFAALLHNAWKFSRERDVVRIEVAGRREGDTVRIEVRDHGIGYDPRYADKLFQPFERLHGASEGAGNGLGLAIAMRIVERHGGGISARSEPGVGSTFTIELPAGDID